jgi:hypothetical protein
LSLVSSQTACTNTHYDLMACIAVSTAKQNTRAAGSI